MTDQPKTWNGYVLPVKVIHGGVIVDAVGSPVVSMNAICAVAALINATAEDRVDRAAKHFTCDTIHMTNYPDATGHSRKPLHMRAQWFDDPACDAGSIILDRAAINANQQLAAMMLHVPHICGDPTCPGNLNRRIIEAAVDVAKAFDKHAAKRGFTQAEIDQSYCGKLSALVAERGNLNNERTDGHG